MAIIIDGKKVAADILEESKAYLSKLSKCGISEIFWFAMRRFR